MDPECLVESGFIMVLVATGNKEAKGGCVVQEVQTVAQQVELLTGRLEV